LSRFGAGRICGWSSRNIRWTFRWLLGWTLARRSCPRNAFKLISTAHRSFTTSRNATFLRNIGIRISIRPIHSTIILVISTGAILVTIPAHETIGDFAVYVIVEGEVRAVEALIGSPASADGVHFRGAVLGIRIADGVRAGAHFGRTRGGANELIELDLEIALCLCGSSSLLGFESRPWGLILTASAERR